MKQTICRTSVWMVLALATALAQPNSLKIVVIAGEDAVNVIQQKTAVNPIVEVRDRNDLPVAGAVVTFTLQGGQQAAFSSGLQSLTVTTNAAGRAAVTGLNPVGSGAYQINVTAAHQAQTATATISQTNVATAAPGAAAAGGVAAAAGATAVASGGGGLSGVAIGAIAAAAGGGAIFAAKAAGGSSDPGSPPPGGQNPPPPPARTTYTGPFQGQLIVTTTTASDVAKTCVSTRAISGVLTMTLEQQADTTLTGSANTNGTQTEVDHTVSEFCNSRFGTLSFNRGGSVSGTPGNLVFSTENTSTGPTQFTVTTTLTFSGALNAGVVSGTMNYSETGSGPQAPPSSGQIRSNGSTTFPVMLR